MNYTLSDMLRDNLVPGIEQLAYAGDPAITEISAVTVQEYPVDDFVQKGDLVLSTAEGCTEKEEKFSAFIRELAENGACGVLFAFRDPSYRFPLALRLQAQRLGLPVFRIPWKVRFAQVQTDLIRQIHRRSIEYLTERKLKSDFVWNLAAGSGEDLPQMAAQGLQLKFDLSRNYACIRFRVILPENTPEYSETAAEAAALAENAVESACRLCGLKGMHAARSMEFLLYSEARPGREAEDVRQIAAALQKKLDEAIPDAQVTFGISPAGEAPADFSKLARQAGMALAYAAGSPGKTYTYKDAKEAALIAVLLQSEEAVAIAQDTLKALRAADEKGSEYGKSLAAYFRCCGNASKAAEELYIHRISLLQRLERIEALTGLSLKDHRDRLLLQLCLRMTSDF